MNYSAEQSELAVPFIAVPLPEDDSHQQEPSQSQVEDASSEASCCDHFLNVALHILLFLQFGIFFWVGDESVANLSWSVVNCSIALYMLTTHLYRECLHWAGVSYDVSMLLPEIMIVVTMALCFFNRVVDAFLLLVLTKLGLALTVVVINGYRLLWRTQDNDDDEVEEEVKQVSIV